jgi:hypothetical protein
MRIARALIKLLKRYSGLTKARKTLHRNDGKRQLHCTFKCTAMDQNTALIEYGKAEL